MDGSDAVAPPVELEGTGSIPILTKSRVVPPEKRVGSLSASCLAQAWDLTPSGPSVERIAVASESVTFEEIRNRSIFGCSHSSGSQDSPRRWCGTAYGRLYGGRLRDPRLDLLCGTADERVGFVWIQPTPRAKYVSVEQPGYTEVYEVAARLPVRVATLDGVVYSDFSASFDVLEHDADGRLLRRYRLEAAVAG